MLSISPVRLMSVAKKRSCASAHSARLIQVLAIPTAHRAAACFGPAED